ncbi:HNH endonuclease signature motif containing protein [Nostoc sp.]|uniref:HNH endonuclease signature motif containing protein n=1 Tax=Nostoc sp. TaxID=1180 RepID=UPI002FF8B48F
MIYKVDLPELTLNRLTDVVYLQMRLLRYAASTSSINEEDCARYLKAYKIFKGRHEQIARWLFNKPKPRELLRQFSQGSTAEKLEWSRCLFREAIVFLTNQFGYITPYKKDSASDWQIAGSEFLSQFYKYLGDGLPDYLFSEKGAVLFSKNDLKLNFYNTNNFLLVCPACDLPPTGIEVDHYLPISIYPHLSCHPFNLVPICSECNSFAVKGNTDLLQKDDHIRRKLEDVFLIYQGYGLGELSYLKIDLKKGHRAIRLIELKPVKGNNIIEHIESYSNLFKIPDRWFKTGRTGETIQYQMFRKIETSVQAAKQYKASLNIFDVYIELNQLLQILCDDRGKEPFAFTMSCWLATLINQEIKPAISSSQQIDIKKFPLLEEIASWVKQDSIQHPAYLDDSRLNKAWNLRKIVAEED